MFLFLVLALALFVLFLLFNGRQSGSMRSGRKSQKKIWPDANSDPFLVSTDVSQTVLGFGYEATHPNGPVVDHVTDSAIDSDLSAGFVDYTSNTYSTGGELGSALADVVDGGGSSFGAFDAGSSDFGGTSDGTNS